MNVKLNKKRGIILIIAGIIAILLYLFSTNFKTPEIKGVVVDAETGTPIEGAIISASWSRTYSGPGGQFEGGTSKEVKITTKADGAFVIPKHTVINLVPYPFGQGGSFSMVVYARGHMNKTFIFYETKQIENPKYDEFKQLKSEKKMAVKLERIKDPAAFIKNSGEIYPDKEYRLKEDQLFVEMFGKKRWKEYHIQMYLANAYARLGDYKSALRKLDEIAEDHPTVKGKYFDEEYKQYKDKAKLQDSKRE